MPAELPMLTFESQVQWEQWLSQNHTSNGLWLKIAKKSSGIPTVTYDQALDVALCYGWIDGQKNSFDADYFLQKFTPRRPRSLWSKRNIDKVAALTKAGRMQPAGQAEVDRAKADGRWAAAYDSPANTSMPGDFLNALNQNPKAKAFFGTLNKTNTFAIYFRITTAKRPDTRTRRIQQFIDMLEKGEKLY